MSRSTSASVPSRSPVMTLLILLNAVAVAVAALPQVDFDKMGRVGVAGAFSGFDLFDNSSVTYDPQTATIFTRDSDGALNRLEATNSGGKITAGCVLGDVYYFAGLFSSIGSTSASNIAAYKASDNTFSALASGGPNGEVDALYCDDDGNKVWVGGNFTSPGAAVAVYDTSANSWSQAPFVGLTGAAARIHSITANSSLSSLFFAGSFVTTFQGNGSAVNGTNNPNVPFSSGATPFSSSLVPVPLAGADVNASPASSDDQFNDITSILCPSGDDGPGNTWLAGDGNYAVINVFKYTSLTANGVRLGNTFIDGHGTTGFSVTTVPDNTIQTLTYVDADGQNQTCSDKCPLSTDSSVLYQDFLFDSTKSITGVQIQLSEWQGASSGLHILQLLSSGAFAGATDEQNGESCYAPSSSGTARTGDWEAVVANTDISGTTQTVLAARVDTNTAPEEGPTFTWTPYVSASGQYDVNIMVPGCSNLQDCGLRTSVSVSIFPGEGMDPVYQTVSQTNEDDETTLIYSGPIVPSSDSFVTTISMRLADDPEGNGQDGQYEIIADRVQLILTSPNVTSGGNSTGGSGSSSSRGSFGFFEYPLNSENVDATQLISNSSQTSADAIGISLFQGLGGNSSLTSSTDATVNVVAHHSSGKIIVGGNFASGANNILVFDEGSVSSPPNEGLNGVVTAMVLDGDLLYVGGEFTDTHSASNGKLRGVAVYDVAQNTWASLGGGVDGKVASLGLSNNQIQVVGNFSQAYDSSDNTTPMSGLATWDLGSSSWTGSGGYLVGDMTFIANGTDDSQFLAGSVISSTKYGSSGLIMLKNGENGTPQVTPLKLSLGSSGVSSTTSTVTTRTISAKRSHAKKSTTWFPKRWTVWARQSSSDLATLPDAPLTPAPAVLAGSFWKNSTADDNEIVIVGGNFSLQSSGTEYQGLAIYDEDAATLTGLPGAEIEGTVRALLVDGDSLYIGGEFNVTGQNLNGFAVYDLAGQKWVSGIESLQAASGSSVVVRSITKSASNENAIVVAGTFAKGGQLQCEAICQLDTSAKRWNNLGDGISGEVSTVVYGGSNQNILFAAGSLALSENESSYVVRYAFENSTWAAVGSSGDLPGPATALEVNNGNTDSIFAAGKSSSGSSFLAYYKDGSWTTLSSLLDDSSIVSQLAMVPLSEDHDVSGPIETDRMLLVSGSLDSPDFGDASSALFDGEKLIPYLTTTGSSGGVGVVAALFHSISSFSFDHRKFFATGVVILISMAIAAGVVFLLALIGILWTLFSRRDEKLNKMDGAVDDDDDDDEQHRPSSLLEHINAATRTTIIGNSPFAAAAVGGYKDDDDERREKGDPFGPDASNYLRAETPSDVNGGMMGEELSRPSHARYSFDGAGEGELPLVAGTEVDILDDRDPAWWYARDVRTGQEGVVPASYLY